MKNMKKFFSLVLAVVMVMGLAVNAFAIEQNVDVQTDEHTYKVYQIFSGSQTADDATLTDIQWGNGVDSAELLAALKADDKLNTFFASCQTAADVAGVLAANNTNETVYNGFSNIAVYHLTNAMQKDGVDIIISDETTTIDLAAGYYLFLDVTPEETLGNNHAHNPALLQVTKAGAITIRKKIEVPTIEKAINDGTEQGVQHISAMIGTDVGFQLTATLPNGMGHFPTYKYIIHDDLPAGMEIKPETIKVELVHNGDWANRVEVKPEAYEIKTSGITCTVFKGGTADGSDNDCDLEIIFADLKQGVALEDGTTHAVSSTDEFFVTYDATISPAAEKFMTENVVILENDAVVEFPNNPNWNPGDPENEGKEPPTGITPESDAKVYLTKVIVEKVDESKRPLKGAQFKLEGTSMKNVITYGEQFVETTEFAASEAKYWKLTDGTYTTTDPATPGTDTSKYDSTTKTYALRDYVISGVVAEDVSITTTMGEDGIVSFAGLGAGNYTLTEIVAPSGYNLLKDEILLVITFHPETETFSYAWKHEGSSTNLSSTNTLQVVNTAGHILPETGGMGTTLFYAVGGLMVLCAVVLLITKKRMSTN